MNVTIVYEDIPRTLNVNAISIRAITIGGYGELLNENPFRIFQRHLKIWTVFNHNVTYMHITGM